MFPAGNILGELCAFSGLFRKKIPKEAIIRLKAGLSLVRLGRRIFSNATASKKRILLVIKLLYIENLPRPEV